MPKGQEAELAGFHLYCTQILAWLPPLIFTIMNEKGLSLSWGGVHLNIYLFVAILFYQLMPSWSDCVASADFENKILLSKKTAVDIEENIHIQESDEDDRDSLESFP